MTKTPGVSVLKSAKGLISATRTDVDSKDQVTKFVRDECLPQLKKLIQEGGNIVSIVDLNRQNNVKTMNELNSSKASIHSSVYWSNQQKRQIDKERINELMEKHRFELDQDDGNEFYQALSRLE